MPVSEPGSKESFFFGGLSPPKKKLPSRRPLRLCGENSILDKNDIIQNNFIHRIAKTPFLCYKVKK
jgi:hypothetical protein